MKKTLLSSIFLAANLFAGYNPYVICDKAPVPRAEPQKFQHTRNTIFSLGDANHSGNDVIVAMGNDAEIPGKFAYGTFSKDITGEAIEIYIDDCSGELVLLGADLTDHDGRTNYVISSWRLPKNPGQYKIVQRVLGDASYVVSYLRIVHQGSPIVVFDMDGTLSISNVEEIKEILFDHNPESRRGAAELTRFWKNKGVEVVYLSGRHYVLTALSRKDIVKSGYAPGTLLTSHGVSEWLPSKSHTGEYKYKELMKLKNQGLLVQAAYGNEKTDVYAYLKAGIPKERVFVVGKRGGYQGTQALGEDFVTHLRAIVQ